ncbi:MAG: acetolactate synthase small subunit [Limnochordaceae bacterium]|nr:acetolactate synthase small subunit [Limnochordaceae bacterium]
MRRVLAVLVRNQPGVMTRVSALFSRRGFNIQSVAVGATDDPALARMTLVLDEDEPGVEQVTKQLHKLVDVIKVSDITDDEPIERELALVRLAADASRRLEAAQMAQLVGARLVDVGEESVTVELTGPTAEVEAALRILRAFGFKELVRSGTVAMARPGRVARTAGPAGGVPPSKLASEGVRVI